MASYEAPLLETALMDMQICSQKQERRICKQCNFTGGGETCLNVTLEPHNVISFCFLYND